MIPTEEHARQLWEKYQLPAQKRLHAGLVARVADVLATKVKSQKVKVKINKQLLCAAALLHDIDKNVEKLPDERHPDAGVRILREEGMAEVANLVKTHSLYAILDPVIAPKTWEEKLLFLADKMVKYEIITVDKRFDLWRKENLPQKERDLLAICYPKVKALESDIFGCIRVHPEDISAMIQTEEGISVVR